MTLDASIFDNLRSELRRGSLILAVLAQLRTEQYGYTLRKALSDHGMEIEESTLYPLLRRLETQGLLRSEWREEDKRNKRFYVLSDRRQASSRTALGRMEHSGFVPIGNRGRQRTCNSLIAIWITDSTSSNLTTHQIAGRRRDCRSPTATSFRD